MVIEIYFLSGKEAWKMRCSLPTEKEGYLYTLAQLSSTLKMICEENRMRVLCFLMQGERCVNEIADALRLPQNLVSHHLKVLWREGVVNRSRNEQDSRWIYYSVNREALADLNALYLSFFDEKRSAPWRACCGSGVPCCGIEGQADGLCLIKGG